MNRILHIRTITESAASLVLLWILMATASSAQARLSIAPSAEVSSVYDDNLFFSSDHRASDTILRVSPALSLDLKSRRWLLSGSYGFDSERFSRHPELSRARARDRRLAALRFQPSAFVAVMFDGSYVDTDTPTEFNRDTGLSAARVRGQQLSLRSSTSFRLSRRTSTRLAYEWRTDRLTAGSSARVQSGNLDVERRLTDRDVMMLHYDLGRYLFDGSRDTGTHVVRLGWNRDLASRTRVSLQVGPRVTDGSLSPEVATSLTHDLGRSRLSSSYVRTQSVVIGQSGTVQTESLEAGVTYLPSRFFTLTATPAIFRTWQEDRTAFVYQVSLSTSFTLRPSLTIDMAYRFNEQRGAIYVFQRPDEKLSHGTLLLSLKKNWNDHRGASATGAAR